jgi:uncharacterized protein with HEPN domain
MLESAYRIRSYTERLDYEAFIDEQKTLDAVVRNFEILGEASTRILADFQLENPQIPWQRLRGYRNRLIHEYFGVDYQIVWEIIQEDLKELIEKLEEIKKTGPKYG